MILTPKKAVTMIFDNESNFSSPRVKELKSKQQKNYHSYKLSQQDAAAAQKIDIEGQEEQLINNYFTNANSPVGQSSRL